MVGKEVDMHKIICVANDKALAGSGLRAEHGIAFWIENPDGVVLFDTSNSQEVLRINLGKLGLQMGKINAVALSHGHYDHTGGLMALTSGEARSTLPVHAHSAIFDERFTRKYGDIKRVSSPFSREAALSSFDFHLSDQPVEILAGVWTSGEIVDRPELEGRGASHSIRKGNSYSPDPYKDDISLVIKTEDGIVLICGCCHAGLLNTLFHIRSHFTEPIHTIIGGTHLISASGSDLRHIIKVLSDEFGDVSYYLNHCTGDSAIQALTETFGSRVHPFPAGAAIEFD